jgi:hypothetical protein
MDQTSNVRRDEARRRAEEKLSKSQQRESEAVRQKEQAAVAVANKTARLRALRLAKEAVDKDTANRAAADKAAKPVKRAPK